MGPWAGQAAIIPNTATLNRRLCCPGRTGCKKHPLSMTHSTLRAALDTQG